MAKKTIDPLASAGIPAEAADLVPAGSAVAAAATTIEVARGAAPPAPVAPVDALAVTEPAPAEPVLPPVAAALPPPVHAPVFVVQRPIVLSWGAGFIRLAAGDEVSEDSYGDGAIERMIQSGAALVPKE